jgi:fatty acid-binding protein DegV
MVSNAFIVTHTERGRQFIEQIASKFNLVEILITEFSPAIGAHNGSGIIGIIFDVED